MKLVQILYSGLGGHGSVAMALRDGATADWSHGMVFFGVEPLLTDYADYCERNAVDREYVATQAGAMWRSWRPLYRALQRMQPSVIVLHSVKNIIPVARYAAHAGVPLVSVEHQANALKNRSERVISRLLMLLSPKVVALTPGYRDELKALVGPLWREGRVQIIPTGIDIHTFKPTEQPKPADAPFKIGMAGRFSKTKRQETLVGVADMLRRRPPGREVHVSLAGDGEHKAQIERQIADLGLGHHVECTGSLGAAAMTEWFGSLDAYVHASDGETLSTSLLQAMACGLPIVASDVPGIRNLVGSAQQNGVLVENGNVAAFADAVRRLIEHPDSAHEMGARGREIAEANYDQRVMFGRYRQLFASVPNAPLAAHA